MYKPSNNLEAGESQRRLCDALFLLLKHHALSEVTVTELCHTADVSRNAFYRNFAGMDDVLLYRLDQECLAFLAEHPGTFQNVEEYFSYFFTFWLARTEVLSAFFDNNRIDLFLERVSLLGEDAVSWPPDMRDHTPMKGFVFVTSGLTGMLYFYRKTKCDIDPRRVAHWLAENLKYGASLQLP